MAVELVVAKALLGPALGIAGKKVTRAVLGGADERELVALCSRSLREALDGALDPYAPIQRGEREHLLAVLEIALEHATEQVEGMSAFGPGDLAQVVGRAHRSAVVDWDTFGLERENQFHRLDELSIFEEFLGGLPTQLRMAARRNGSALSNLVAQVNFGELVVSLNDIRRAIVKSAAVGTTTTVADAVARARDRQRTVIAARLANELTRSPYLETEQVRQWQEWHKSQPWTRRVSDALAAVAAVLEDEIADVAAVLIQAAGHIADQPMMYPACRQLLKELPLTEASAAMTLLSDPSKQVRPVGLDDARRRLRWVERQMQEPLFEHTFNVAGSFGSGTSQFLTRVAEIIDENGDLVIFVTADPGESFTRAIFRRFSEFFGMGFRDLTDVQVLLGHEHHPRWLYLMVEDVDQKLHGEAALSDLLASIEASTAVDGIRWCLGANLDNLSSALSSERPYFWSTYGAHPKKPKTPDSVIDGWVDLDALNADNAVGLRLLDRLVAEERPDLRTILDHRKAFQSEADTYANPLPAWMRYETMIADPESRPVSDPQDPAFIRRYWTFLKLRVFKSATSPLKEVADAETEHAVTMIARQLRICGQTSVALYTAGTSEVATNAPDLEASATLRRMGLLRLAYQGDQEVEPLVLAAIPVFIPFWGYRIGRLIMTDLEHGSEDAGLELWFERASHGEALAEVVCQFVLGGLAEDGRDYAKVIWQTWMNNLNAPAVPFLMAAAAAPQEFSRFAIRVVEAARYRPLSKRETFVMMRLVAKVSLPDWEADERLSVLRVQRPTIAGHGLHTYASFTTRTVLTTPAILKRENYVNTCLALLGCEETGTAAIAARLMVDNGFRLFANREDLVGHAIRFFHRASGPSRQTRVGGSAPNQTTSGKPPQLTRPDRSTFVQQFIDALLTRLVHGPDAAETVRMLARFGWWSGTGLQIDGAVAFYMSQQLNLAFGATCHRKGPDAAYVRVVEDVLAGTLLPFDRRLECFRIAMYIIKHSVPTRARWDLEVHPSLHPALSTLWRNQAFRKRESPRLQTLCGANGIGV